eukprot:TRINITY_DN2360_c0_g2_i2.p1 TRINITY_DN2360_c0_g2~~TRINITY_DN2360_c0_g2_i2.p1  ORF type:complete len:151 (-),score=12.56 TRINITY_DN2360_c0_g2_i2:372-824(-)
MVAICAHRDCDQPGHLSVSVLYNGKHAITRDPSIYFCDKHGHAMAHLYGLYKSREEKSTWIINSGFLRFHYLQYVGMAVFAQPDMLRFVPLEIVTRIEEELRYCLERRKEFQDQLKESVVSIGHQAWMDKLSSVTACLKWWRVYGYRIYL